MLKKKRKLKPPKTFIGWQEWCELPDLGLPAIKAKVDTGAKTSAIHAYDISVFKKGFKKYVRFKIHPLQRNNKLEQECVALLVDQRQITSSNGEREKRYVIRTEMVFGEKKFEGELTLTSRHEMAYRMLLGRAALRDARFVVNPARSFLLGKKTHVEELYKNSSE